MPHVDPLFQRRDCGVTQSEDVRPCPVAYEAHPECGLQKDPSGLKQGRAEETLRCSQRGEHQEALLQNSAPSWTPATLGSFETGLKFDLLLELTGTMIAVW